MKVEKIDIKKEILDIPDNQPIVRFAIRPDLSAILCEEGKVPSENVTMREEVYEVRKYHKNFGEKEKMYLVRVDDNHLFNELAQITQDDLEGLEMNWLEKFMSFKAPIIRKDVRDSIKGLCWWKRLLKRF